ncbi:hypothetical protein L7F22_051462 [Adiantum nelumboides]|nr:hypothetical protein [Adiantum nelumboides]
MEEETEQIIYNMRIPEYIMQVSMQQTSDGLSDKLLIDRHTSPPKLPTLVLVNSKSGGQRGRQFLSPCRVLLTPAQVVDLNEVEPETLLQRVLGGLERLCIEGDHIAAAVKENLRIIVAGGDGTVGWVLGIIANLNLSHPPPIAPIPFGTGNNLHYSFGWGRKNVGTDLNSIRSLLIDVAKARVLPIDSWLAIMKVPVSTVDTLEHFTAPQPMQALDLPSSSNDKESTRIFGGRFWNYFSLGMDAQVAFSFHQRRRTHPKNFKSQLKNQLFVSFPNLNHSAYGMIGCVQGWYCVRCFHPASRNINHLGKIMYAKHDEDWQELALSPSIRSIIFLNLPSFSGGFDPWGHPNPSTAMKRSLTEPRVDDGILEIVGFRDGWHGLSLLFPGGHGTRLAQAHKIRLEISSVNHTYMRMDGEPWLQPLPEKDFLTIIEISHGGRSLVLATERSIIKT